MQYTPSALVAAFVSLPDPRRPRGRRFPPPRSSPSRSSPCSPTTSRSSPSPSSAGGNRPPSAPPSVSRWPCAPSERPPRLFHNLDPLTLAVALTAFFAPTRSPDNPRGGAGIALGGKAHRGRLAYAEHPDYPVHMLSAVSPTSPAPGARSPSSSTPVASSVAPPTVRNGPSLSA